MARLFGAGHDPVTDAALGRPYVTAPPLAERIAAAVATLSEELSPESRYAGWSRPGSITAIPAPVTRSCTPTRHRR